jgi:hypothetical protein
VLLTVGKGVVPREEVGLELSYEASEGIQQTRKEKDLLSRTENSGEFLTLV